MYPDLKIDQKNAITKNEAFQNEYDSGRNQKLGTDHTDFRQGQRDKKVITIVLAVIAVLMILSWIF
ncbi:MAG: hypothetical protein ACI4WR_00965 [Bulleidia sp.]